METSNMFDWLISPFNKSAFFNDIWQKKSEVLVSGRDRYFDNLFSLSDLETIIEFCQPSPPMSIRLVSAGSDKRVEVPLSPNGRINIDQLRKLYISGNTVILNSVENFNPMVARLARAIETELGARVQINAYLTPRSAQGFHPHYDTHDVLVVQISGEKLWKVYGGESVCPLNEMVDGEAKLRDHSVTPSTISLKSGDVLYIPRGWIHEAVTNQVASLHLTIGIHPPLGKDLLSAALDQLETLYPELREALPVGQLSRPETKEYIKARYADLAKLFASHDLADEAAKAIDDQFIRRGRSGGDGHLFSDAESLKNITNNTVIERRLDVPCQFVEMGDEVGVQFLNGIIKGPDLFRSPINFVLKHSNPFAVSEIPELADGHQVIFATSLVADGLCRIVEVN